MLTNPKPVLTNLYQVLPILFQYFRLTLKTSSFLLFNYFFSPHSLPHTLPPPRPGKFARADPAAPCSSDCAHKLPACPTNKEAMAPADEGKRSFTSDFVSNVRRLCSPMRHSLHSPASAPLDNPSPREKRPLPDPKFRPFNHKRQELAAWNSNEISLYTVFAKMFEYNSCALAKVIPTKNCKQVGLLLELYSSLQWFLPLLSFISNHFDSFRFVFKTACFNTSF